MLGAEERAAAASALRAAQADAAPIDPLTDTWPDVDVEDAYAIQLDNAQRRITDGATVRGHKVGLSSRAMQEMLGVAEPDYGLLFDDMFLFEATELPSVGYCAPRIEVEVGFVLDRSLPSEGCTVADVLRSTAYVVPCIEIIDSRIRDWKITLPDTVADNASAAGVVIGGATTRPDGIDLRTIGAVVRRNGEIVDTGASGAVLGNPATAVAWLANKVGHAGVTLDAGHVILPGSCTRAHDVSAGDHVRADFDALGYVQIAFGE